jgi:hypothetical protein
MFVRVFLFAVLLAACPKLATENERCQKSTDCVMGLTCCSGACIDVQKDTRHCGACGAACATQNALAACQAGVCKGACAEGFADCNQAQADGCEVNLKSDLNHCGECGKQCLLSSASATCSAGTCAISSCAAGAANCDNRASNGCEVNVAGDTMNCGQCGTSCSLPFATARCFSSQCAVATCEPGRGDCDGMPTTGCETDVRTSLQHCGLCGQACAADRTCVQGTCRLLELFAFGGLPDPTSFSPVNTVMRLQLGQRSFTEVMTLPASGPSARSFHAAAYDPMDSRMLMIGGTGPFGSVNADLWELSFSATPPTWSRPPVTGTPPPALAGQASGWDAQRRRWYLFGGSSNGVVGTPTDELFVLDAATMTWSQPTVTGATPPARAHAAAMFDDASGRFIVFGGLSGPTTALGDTWAFTPATSTWTSAAMSGPTPRAGATFFAGSSPPMLFGGAATFDQGSTHEADLWELDATSLTWTSRTVMNGPAARRHMVGLTIAGSRTLIGGLATDGPTALEYTDVWALSSLMGPWQQLRSNSPSAALSVSHGFTVIARETP